MTKKQRRPKNSVWSNSYRDGARYAAKLGLHVVFHKSLSNTLFYRYNFCIPHKPSRMLRLRGDRTKVRWCPMSTKIVPPKVDTIRVQ